ncbi:hypothetical protein [Kineococcus esterisolvens]|uniref:hypothetical protein n=1 Tax=unclassified Kineococcus TaxID=2621656 RepID=UPI003D7C3C3B
MHPELEAALVPVLADLHAPSGVVPTVSDEQWQDYPGAASCVLHSPGHFALGVWIATGQPFATQVAALADQVQEFAVEALWLLGRSASWPACPHHPDRHPLAARERGEQAVWTCPVLQVDVSTIGALSGTGPREPSAHRRA